MEYIDEPKTASLLSFDVILSLILLIVTLLAFKDTIGGAFSGEEETRLAPIKFFMLAMVCISFLILLMYGSSVNRENIFLWLAVAYVFLAFFSTLFSGLYVMLALPFKFVRISYWACVLIISYYSVLHLKTFKFHVALVILLLPVLFYFYLVSMRAGRAWIGNKLALNPVFYISFLMPAVLLLRSKILKIGGVLIIFVAVLMSYKRSAMLSFLTAIPVYFYALINSGSNAKLKKLVPILFGGTFLLILFVVLFKFVSGAADLDWAGRLEGLTTDRGAGRLDRYIGYLSMISSQPFIKTIMGNGYWATQFTRYSWAHNDIIEVLYDFGLVGLTLYLLFIGQLAKLFFQMKKYKYKHFDAFAVSLVLFFWGSMVSMLIMVPYWFLNLAFFWGWVIADFHNAKISGDPEKIGNPLYAYAYEYEYGYGDEYDCEEGDGYEDAYVEEYAEYSA